MNSGKAAPMRDISPRLKWHQLLKKLWLLGFNASVTFQSWGTLPGTKITSRFSNASMCSFIILRPLPHSIAMSSISGWIWYTLPSLLNSEEQPKERVQLSSMKVFSLMIFSMFWEESRCCCEFPTKITKKGHMRKQNKR